MKRVTEPGTVLLWDGEPMRVVAIAEGRTIYLREIGQETAECPSCGRVREISVLERSPLFQENAEPVPTLEVTP